ncbi:hypothetical protein BVRB_034690, partial [Beta vulgaris subsp. vulgaris]
NQEHATTMTTGLRVVVALKLVGLASVTAWLAYLRKYYKVDSDADYGLDALGNDRDAKIQFWLVYLAIATPDLLYCWFARQAWRQRSATKANTAKNIAIVLLVVAASATAYCWSLVTGLVWTIFAVYCADESAKKYSHEAASNAGVHLTTYP